MCFSATASFVAGATLSAAGVATLTQARHRSEIPFAAIPLLFGIQQITEGVLWVTFRHDAPVLKQTMTDVYSVFSHVWWPIYVPFAIGYLEASHRRKTILLAFVALSALASVGCKKKGADGGSGDAVAKMTELKNKMCECKAGD